MRDLTRFSLLALLAGAFLVRPLDAQFARERSGFWIRAGIGAGSANYMCNECGPGPRIDGVTGSLEMGGTLSPSLRLGGFVNGWTRDDQGDTQTMSTVGAALYYYPERASGFFIKGGFGFSSYHESGYGTYDNLGRYYVTDPVTGTGLGFTTGAGFEIPIGRTVSLVPFLDYSWGGVGQLDFPDGSIYATGWNQNFASLGLSIQFGSGRSDRGRGRGRHWR